MGITRVWHQQCVDVAEMRNAYTRFPLPPSHVRVFAHVGGPSGSGKSELMYNLERVVRTMIFRDLDEFDEHAVAQLGWSHLPKNDYTDDMLIRLTLTKQQLLNAFIRTAPSPIALFGHHIEAGYPLRLHAYYHFLLNVAPTTAATRRFTRYGSTIQRLHQDIAIGREDVHTLQGLGYVPLTPRQIYRIITGWSNQLMERKEEANGDAYQ